VESVPNRVILDIETVGIEWDSLPESTQEYLLKYQQTEKDEERTKSSLAFWAPTAKVIIIGLLNPDTQRAMILAEGPQGASQMEKEAQEGHFGDIVYSIYWGDEAALLKKFWELIPKYPQYITYNGRRFDCPFLMQRSLILSLTPSRNLDTPRYQLRPHLDLLDVLTFYGATRRFTLQFWCQTLGIEDPKADFGDGAQVQKAYKEGRLQDIIAYNLSDLRATAHLYQAVDERILPVWESR
jgi:DNA polymerase elongation subunit (family B)